MCFMLVVLPLGMLMLGQGLKNALGGLMHEYKTRGMGGENMILVQTYPSSHIFIFSRLILSFHMYTFLLFPVDAYTFQSLKKRENVIFQNMLFIFFIIFLSFLVCFVTCTIFSICLNLSSMSAWISVLQSFVVVL